VERGERDLAQATGLRERVHAEVVADYDAREAEAVSQEVAQDAPRQRGGTLRVERRIDDVCRHQERDAGADRGAERPELDAVEVPARSRDAAHGQGWAEGGGGHARV